MVFPSMWTQYRIADDQWDSDLIILILNLLIIILFNTNKNFLIFKRGQFYEFH